MTDPVQTFRDEALEHLANLETALLELEESPHEAEQIDSAFRAMHTIKGAAGMVGFDHLSHFTHHLETFFDKVRSGEIELNQTLINLVLEARDHIEALLDQVTPNNELQTLSEGLIGRFAEIMSVDQDTAPARQQRSKAETPAEEQIYSLDIVPAESAFRDGFDLLPLLRELHGLGQVHVSTFFERNLDLNTLDPESCALKLSLLITTTASRDTIEGVFFFVFDDWRIDIKALSFDEACRLGDLLIERGVVVPSELEKVLGARPKTGELIQRAGLAQPEEIERALSEQQYIREQQQKRKPPQPEQSIKVPQHKLDLLMDQIGELVIMQARLDQMALDNGDERLGSLAEELDRLSTGLRETTFDIRMLPIGSTFGRFRRLVRDLSHELGKEVVLETEGAETELDKVVIDRLADPLVHLLRNSLDHGIEPPEERRAKGKPERGLLSLSASQHQGQILIRIRDDGAGLDRDRILAKARERGIIGEDGTLEDHEIYQLIFEAGFSTAAQVSDVSGRGVGMDVVRRSIESLQGRVQLHSNAGEGTEVRITLPMTLAIIDGLMVGVSDERYVLPLSTVEECIETSAREKSQRNAVRLIRHRDALIPCLRLREFFRVSGTQPTIEQTVVVRIGDVLLGITVDVVIGHFQTVIKNLGRLYQGVHGVMGATIMGNGQIAMILDAGELVDEAKITGETLTK